MADNNKSYKKSNFGGAFFFLPKRRREALAVIYAFCRLADDTADENYPDAPQRLQALYDEINRVFGGKPQTVLGADLAAVTAEFNIPKQYFLDLLDGMKQDLQPKVRCKDTEAQMLYMYRAAGAVGLMCLGVFGCQNAAAGEYAKKLGSAVQLTNILRDFAEDAKINRIYLPLDILAEEGIQEQDILSLKETPAIKKLLARQAERAKEYYKEARALLPEKDFKKLLAARAMGNLYEAILDKFIKTGCSFRGKKIKLSKIRKVLILFKTWRENP